MERSHPPHSSSPIMSASGDLPDAEIVLCRMIKSVELSSQSIPPRPVLLTELPTMLLRLDPCPTRMPAPHSLAVPILLNTLLVMLESVTAVEKYTPCGPKPLVDPRF